MSTSKAFWLASAAWLLAVCVAGLALGVSSWVGGAALAISGLAPMLIAFRFWAAPEPSLSESIQRELR
jgi:hypothetical protein